MEMVKRLIAPAHRLNPDAGCSALLQITSLQASQGGEIGDGGTRSLITHHQTPSAHPI